MMYMVCRTRCRRALRRCTRGPSFASMYTLCTYIYIYIYVYVCIYTYIHTSIYNNICYITIVYVITYNDIVYIILCYIILYSAFHCPEADPNPWGETLPKWRCLGPWRLRKSISVGVGVGFWLVNFPHCAPLRGPSDPWLPAPSPAFLRLRLVPPRPSRFVALLGSASERAKVWGAV